MADMTAVVAQISSPIQGCQNQYIRGSSHCQSKKNVPAKDNNPFSFKKFLQNGPPNSGVIYDLPDLLDTVDSTECASPSNGLSEDLDVRRMRELTEENSNLRRALRESQLRVGQVELQMKQQAVKEAEETQALEQMVQQVEGNLKTANYNLDMSNSHKSKYPFESKPFRILPNQDFKGGGYQSRALKAEQTIVQLRQEISILKANSADPQSIMKDKTKYAAEQLAATATTAEANLKQMMEGVKKLRLMSEILASVDSTLFASGKECPIFVNARADVPAKDNNPFSFKKFLQTGPPNSGVIYDLPDLLDTVDSTECASPSNGLSEDLDVRRMRELTEENSNLRRALRESQLRVGQVELQMKQQAVKEAEETQALEQMVQQVEGNLKTANSRALKAEQTIVQLRQEISILKANSADPQSIMKDKTKYAAEQLAATATTAEANLKQMMEGVKKLRLMSEILASVDSVTEES
ncbi:hypothetical protein CAPTEDRAFT_224903 [Capitella teleta]|uniref:Endosome-associated-trafficking regulator 1 n=1 Tax=Capitella teleta TaxID=283909 RepID=R7V849_CAPTE|nr:hypothetical protein CAPTEDRAFT_224903 [Capitella teleta]|eukprot:ELU14689.1 hypothetical protein CAPTEDRAFT_224903 [Capitella teleta]